jgi:hypothetical protein
MLNLAVDDLWTTVIGEKKNSIGKSETTPQSGYCVVVV